MLFPEFFVLWSWELKLLTFGLVYLPSNTLYPRVAIIRSLGSECEDFVVFLECYLELRVTIRCNETLIQVKVDDTSENQRLAFAFLAVLELTISDFDELELLTI